MSAIFFDFDGVLTRDKTGSLTTFRYISKATGIEMGRLQSAFKKYNADLNLGRLTYGDIWPDVCDALAQEIDIALLRSAFESTPMNGEMIELAHNLKTEYCVGIITDNKKDRIEHLRRYMDLDVLFHPIVVSAEVGSDKTDKAIFQCALERLGVDPGESVFIDNSRENLRAPQALGMRTIYFDDALNDLPALISELERSCGICVPGTM